jgi:hypothetical protein
MKNTPHIHRAVALIKDSLKNELSLSRRQFLCASSALGAAISLPTLTYAASKLAREPVLGEEDIAFLKTLAEATIERARVRPAETRGSMPANNQGIVLITPGGNYPALWIRDFAMSLDCDLIDVREVVPQLLLIARCQNGGKERRLRSGAVIPPFAIPDHINFDGGAVFYPGTYSAGEDQGADPWGPIPPMDDHFYFIHIAYYVWRKTRDAKFLSQSVDGIDLFARLEFAINAPLCNVRTGAAVATKDRRAVGFGFQDSVYLLGSLSFATLLRYRALKQMAELSQALGKQDRSAGYADAAKRIAAHFVEEFTTPGQKDGWLLAATEVGRQPDVWATLFALYLGILPEDAAAKARKTIAAAVKAPGNTIEYQGAVRHVPSDRYFRPDQCWESAVSKVNMYQSGAFWHTPTGWLIEALQAVDPTLARQVAGRFMQHLREGDFRRGTGRGAPWECFGIDMAHAQNPVYMTSVTLPLAALKN